MSPVRLASDAVALRVSAQDTDLCTSVEHLKPEPGAEIDSLLEDRDFVALRGHDLARLLEDHVDAYVMSLEKLIASGTVFGFEWGQTFWVPMFQFDVNDLSPKQGLRQVLAELATVFDGWTLAVWFVRPSSWLNGRKPVELLDSNPSAVVEAARTERSTATGPFGSLASE